MDLNTSCFYSKNILCSIHYMTTWYIRSRQGNTRWYSRYNTRWDKMRQDEIRWDKMRQDQTRLENFRRDEIEQDKL